MSSGPIADSTSRCGRCAIGCHGNWTAPMQTTLGTPTLSAMAFFVVIVALTLVITWWAARHTRSAREFYAAGRSISALQNGLALAGDYMSAASFLGIAGL